MIKKKVYGLVAILSLSFAGVAMAASSATYSGEFVSVVTSINSIDVTGGDMTIKHTQSNTAQRNVAIKALRKGKIGYSTEKTVANISSNVTGKSISASELTDGNYKLQCDIGRAHWRETV